MAEGDLLNPLEDLVSSLSDENESSSDNESSSSSPRATSSSSPYDKDILGTFRCPRDCNLYEPNYAAIINCPFSHLEDENFTNKKKLPSFACLKNLLGECLNPVAQENLVQTCKDGFHLSTEELVDLDHYSEKMAYSIRKGTKRSFPENSTIDECCICLSEFTEAYGQLSDCNHVFCVTCIRDWFKNKTKKSCPVCRKASSYIVYWPELISSKTIKRDIFFKQALAVDSSMQEAIKMALAFPFQIPIPSSISIQIPPPILISPSIPFPPPIPPPSPMPPSTSSHNLQATINAVASGSSLLNSNVANLESSTMPVAPRRRGRPRTRPS